MDWLDFLVVQGTLKGLLQHHSSKASILQHLAFFIIQLLHPYMTTGKIIALTRHTFVGKVMSLLFKPPKAPTNITGDVCCNADYWFPIWILYMWGLPGTCIYNKHCVCWVAHLCLTLCDLMGCSPPDSSVHGILQARILEWVAILFWRDRPGSGIEPLSPALQEDSSPSEPPGKPL